MLLHHLIINNNIKDDIIKYINIEYSDNYPSVFISHSFEDSLKNIKNNIDNNNISTWNNNKKYIYEYEFIHTSVSKNNTNISALNVISRSFYKLIEIVLKNNIRDLNNCFHLAEAPGGFIDAIIYLNTINNTDGINNRYNAISLISDNNIPSWNKLINKYNNKINNNIFLLTDFNGDLYNVNMYDFVYNNYSNSTEFITADGGINLFEEYNNQEALVTKLILLECIYAIIIQKKHGNFILKIFDIFTKPTVEIIYILTFFYEKVYICKPLTSRTANSEKYINCINFKYTTTKPLYKLFRNIIININKNKYIKNILSIEVPLSFLETIEIINSIIIKQQIMTVYNINNLCENSNKTIISSKIKKNITLCKKWCNDHKIPIKELDNFIS